MDRISKAAVAKFNKLDPLHQGEADLISAWRCYALEKDEKLEPCALVLKKKLWKLFPKGLKINKEEGK